MLVGQIGEDAARSGARPLTHGLAGCRDLPQPASALIVSRDGRRWRVIALDHPGADPGLLPQVERRLEQIAVKRTVS